MNDSVSLLCRLEIPACRFRVVLRDTLALVIKGTEVALSVSVSLVGGSPIPLRRSYAILDDAPTPFIRTG